MSDDPRSTLESKAPGEELDLGDDFEILGLLGQGSYGVVFKARQKSLDRLVAIKALTSVEPTARARFERECVVLSSIRHENVVAVYDARLTGERPVLICEYVEGTTLAGRIQNEGNLRPSRALDLFIPVLEGLAQVHEAGVVHRDFKSENILVNSSGVAKLTDFGIASSRDSTQDVTATGMIVGTPAYMAPEQTYGHDLDGRADLYAAGVILFEMLAGRLPLDDPNPLRVVVMQREVEAPRLIDIVPTVGEGLSLVVQRCLAKNPDHRFESARDLIAALREAQRERVHSSAVQRRTVARPGTDRRNEVGAGVRHHTGKNAILDAMETGHRSHRRRVGVGLAILLAMLGLGWVFARPERSDLGPPPLVNRSDAPRVPGTPPILEASGGTLTLSMRAGNVQGSVTGKLHGTSAVTVVDLEPTAVHDGVIRWVVRPEQVLEPFDIEIASAGSPGTAGAGTVHHGGLTKSLELWHSRTVNAADSPGSRQLNLPKDGLYLPLLNQFARALKVPFAPLRVELQGTGRTRATEGRLTSLKQLAVAAREQKLDSLATSAGLALQIFMRRQDARRALMAMELLSALRVLDRVFSMFDADEFRIDAVRQLERGLALREIPPTTGRVVVSGKVTKGHVYIVDRTVDPEHLRAVDDLAAVTKVGDSVNSTGTAEQSAKGQVHFAGPRWQEATSRRSSRVALEIESHVSKKDPTFVAHGDLLWVTIQGNETRRLLLDVDASLVTRSKHGLFFHEFPSSLVSGTREVQVQIEREIVRGPQFAPANSTVVVDKVSLVVWPDPEAPR